MILINPIFLLLWLVASWIIGLLGKHRRFGFAGNFLVSLIFSPLVGLLVLLASDVRGPDLASLRRRRRARAE